MKRHAWSGNSLPQNGSRSLSFYALNERHRASRWTASAPSSDESEWHAARIGGRFKHSVAAARRSDQIVPIADSALLSAKIIKGAVLKVYKGASHGLCTTLKSEVDEDLLAFISA